MRVAVDLLFPNCPRYIHRMQQQETSPCVPCAGLTAPEPAWKRMALSADVLPRRNPG